MTPPRPTGPVRRVYVGRIRRPVGLKGEVAVEPSGDDPERFAAGKRILIEGDPEEERIVERSRPAGKGGIAVQFRGIGTVEAAEEFRGRSLYVRPEDLPDLPVGAHYHFELIGLEVVDAQGESLGCVTAILETGSNDVYCVATEGEEILVPAIPGYVKEIDLRAGRIRLAVSRRALGIDEPPV